MVKIILYDDIKGKCDTLVLGFKGFGYVGYLAINHLISQLKAKFIGLIDTIYMPHQVLVNSGITRHPFELYIYRNIMIPKFEDISVNEDGALLLKKFIEWASKEKIEKFVMVGGLDKAIRREKDTPVKYIVNTIWIEKYGKPDGLLEDNIRVIGPLALSFHYTTIYRIPAIGILSYADPGGEDLYATSEAINALNKLLDIDVDTKELIIAAETIEKHVKKIEKSKEDKGRGIYI